MTLKIGLTGGIASGKSTVGHYFKELGIPVLNADHIAHSLTTKEGNGYQPIVDHFGPSILTDTQEINRKLLRQTIFNQPQEKQWLENLLHPLIRATLKEMISQITAPYCIIEIPLLTESKAIDFIDRILVVDCPEAVQIERLIKRDATSQEEALRLLETQNSREKRLERADDVLENTGDLIQLKNRVQELNRHYHHLATQF